MQHGSSITPKFMCSEGLFMSFPTTSNTARSLSGSFTRNECFTPRLFSGSSKSIPKARRIRCGRRAASSSLAVVMRISFAEKLCAYSKTP